MINLDWTVIRTGATGGLILLVPAVLLAGYSLGDGATAGWAWLFLAVVVTGFTLAGYVAGRLRLDTPMLHGGLAGLLAWVVAQTFGVVVSAARGASFSVVTAAVTGLLAVTLGVAGGLMGDWFHRRSDSFSQTG